MCVISGASKIVSLALKMHRLKEKKEIHFDPQESQMSSYPNILERAFAGATVAFTAESSFLHITEKSGWGAYFKKHIFTSSSLKQLTKHVSIFRF